MAVLFRDDFTDTDAVLIQSHTPTWSAGGGTGSVGGGWTKISGADSAIITNRMRGGFGSASTYRNTNALGVENYVITARVRRMSSTGLQFEVRFRQSTDGNTTYRLAYNDSTNVWQLRRIVGGTFQLVDGSPADFTDDTVVGGDMDVQITVDGSSIVILIDGVQRFNATDNAIATGQYVGWDSSAGDASGAHLDWISVDTVSAPATPPTADFTTSVNLKAVTVTDASTAGTNPITSWTWNWGDGTANGAGQVPGPHTYSVGGTYTITLTVSDGTLSDDATGSITTKTRRYVTVKTVGGRSATASVDVNDA